MENKEHNLQDKRCECCGYMTYQREHMSCIRAARQSIAAAEQAQQGEPVAWQLFKQALFVGMERACIHYLMANAHGRRNGALKAHNHEELCKHIVAAVRGCDPDLVRRQHEDDYQAVHDGTQALTSYLDEVIGFPLDSRPDYDDLTPKFFDKFFELAMAALGVSPVAQQPAQQQAEPVARDVLAAFGSEVKRACVKAWGAADESHEGKAIEECDITAIVDRYAAQPPAVALAVPYGYALVPIEPTRAMIDSMPPVEEDGYWAMYEAAIAAAPKVATQSAALADIAAERRRQIEQEGWTPEHDDAHSDGQMATAAACYAISAHSQLRYKRIIMPSWWPWDSTWWKPSTTRRDLVKAGALIAAEIERLDRAAQKGGQ